MLRVIREINAFVGECLLLSCEISCLQPGKKAYDAMTSLAPGYGFGKEDHSNDVKVYRFFSTDVNETVRIPGTYWRFPIVDIMFYDENASHVWSNLPWYKDLVWSKQDVIFPLRRRPLGELRVPAPCNVSAYLSVEYGNLSDCATAAVDHHTYRSRRVTHIPCKLMARRLPWVRRSFAYVDGRPVTIEKFVQRERVLNEFQLAPSS